MSALAALGSALLGPAALGSADARTPAALGSADVRAPAAGSSR